MLPFYYRKFRNLPLKQQQVYLFATLVFIFFIFAGYFSSAPHEFPLNEVITIEDGKSLQEITKNLEDENIIKFPFIFRSTVILLGGERRVIAGDYLLSRKVSSFKMAIRLVSGNFNMEKKKITILEGWSIMEMAEYLEKSIKNFSKEEFIKIAKNKEGYLFPDTYFVGDSARPRTLINIMSDTFESRIKSLPEIATSTYTLNEIITMASILEGEAHTTRDRQIISGILWKRLEVGMPLQVDATFAYINGKGTFDLTLKDLKIDSPYNTYKYKGLPPTPINNPGLDAIFAALNPIQSKYLYFLTGHDGKMYYAKTFTEHKRNKLLHLN